MEAIRAERILTMNPERPEIVDGGILIRDGRIQAVEPWKKLTGMGVCHELGAVTIVPGLINAHVHLELSHLAGQIPAGLGFAAWAESLFAAMRATRVSDAVVERAVGEALASGTCFMADVNGREFDMVCRALERLGMRGHLFREFSGLGRGQDLSPESLPGSWSPSVHALYSTAPAFAQAIKRWCARHALPFTLHLSEVPGENELFQRGSGDFADFMRLRRILPKGFAASGLTAVAYAQELGLLDGHTLAVHCVQVDERDIRILAQSGAFVCLCPRSNAWIGVGVAPVAALHAAGVPLCLGTDSFASTPSLDLWDDLRAVKALLPSATPLSALLDLVTRNPAKALSIDADHGSLEVGKRASWTILPEDLAAAV